ncbi:MAG: monoheme cytochrome SoxX [Thiobacillaceae bacterium]|jgi:hypothetical protein
MLSETQFFIYLSPQSLAVLKGRARKLEWLGEIPGGESGLAALAGVLLGQHIHPVWLMVDSVDEDYRLETLPHVHGKARKEMLNRRLRQIYRGQPFCTAWRQGRQTDGRKDDRYLFSALNDTDWLMPWLSAITSLGFPLAGVSLGSSAAQALLTRLKIRDPQVLLVTRQSAGLRFSYFQQGLLRFSRLTPGDRGELNCADEVSKTLLYLTSQRIVPREARCTVFLLNLENDHGSTLASLNADPLFDARQVPANQIAEALHVPEEFLQATPGIALLGAQAGMPPVINLAPGRFTREYQLHRIRRAINGTALACLMGGAVAAGAQWSQANQYKSDTLSLAQDLARNDSLYRDTLRQYPLISVPPDMLRQAVQIAHSLESGPRSPEVAFAAVSHALDRHPAVILQSLTWEDKLAAGTGHGSHLELRADVEPFDGNYRVAVDQIKSFIATLSAQPDISSVSLIEGPVSSESNSPLSGSTLDNRKRPEANFRLSFEHVEGES